MSDSIPKSIGQQLGGLAKHIAGQVAKTPGRLAGLDKDVGTQETGSQKTPGQKSATTQAQQDQQAEQRISQLRQAEETKRQRALEQVRRELLRQFQTPTSQELSVSDKIAAEQKQAEQEELAKWQTQAQMAPLPETGSKKPRGQWLMRKMRKAEIKSRGG